MALKSGKWASFETPYLRMFRVILMLGNYQYIRGTLAQMCVFEYQKRHGHVIWEMLQHDLACGNEEIGEISFAELSRCTSGDTRLHVSEHVEKMYRLLPIFRQCVSDIEGDMEISGGGSGYVFIKSNSVEVRAVVALMQSSIRKTLKGVSTCYNERVLKVSGGVNLNKINQSGWISNSCRRVNKPYYKKDLEEDIVKAASKLESDCSKDEAKIWDEIWHHMPEVAAQSARPSDTEEEEEKEEEEAAPDEVVVAQAEPTLGAELEDDEELAVVEEQPAVVTYTVNRFVGDFKKDGVKYLKVRWRGYQSTTNELESDMLKDVPEEVALYYEKKKTLADTRRRAAARRRREDPAYKPTEDTAGRPKRRRCTLTRQDTDL